MYICVFLHVHTDVYMYCEFINKWCIAVIVWLQPATKGPRGHPSPRWGAEVNGKKQAKKNLVGRDKGSLTEQQTKGTVTTTIQIRRKHNTKEQNAQSRSHRLLPRTPEPWLLPAAQLPPARTQHDGTWYGIPCSVWPGGSARLAVSPSGSWWKLTLSWPKPGQ